MVTACPLGLQALLTVDNIFETEASTTVRWLMTGRRCSAQVSDGVTGDGLVLFFWGGEGGARESDKRCLDLPLRIVDPATNNIRHPSTYTFIFAVVFILALGAVACLLLI